MFLIRFFHRRRVERCHLVIEVFASRQCIAIVPNRPSSVKERIKKFPPNACRGERCGGLGAHSPQQTGSSHGGEGFIGQGFPEGEEQYGELSCDGDDGPLLGLGCSLPGKT